MTIYLSHTGEVLPKSNEINVCKYCKSPNTTEAIYFRCDHELFPSHSYRDYIMLVICRDCGKATIIKEWTPEYTCSNCGWKGDGSDFHSGPCNVGENPEEWRQCPKCGRIGKNVIKVGK